jgi:protein arginine N-methyltransferase 1
MKPAATDEREDERARERAAQRVESIADPSEEAQLGQFIPLHYHGQMLADDRRVEPFKEAIEKLVPLGSHVVELGGGTGIMSFFAQKRARKVTCVERLPHVAAAARRLLDENGALDKVTVVQADARSYVPDEPADVVICEMLHSGLLRERQAEVLTAFKRHHEVRFGRPIPRILPEATFLAVQPLWQPYTFHGYHAPVPLFADTGPRGQRPVPLGAPLVYALIEYVRDFQLAFDFDGLLAIDHAGSVNALRFITKNVVGIFPSEGRSADWHMHYLALPLARPVRVEAGSQLRLRFRYEAGGSIESLVSTLSLEPAGS